MTNVAFVTYDKLPDLTPDDQLAVAELAKRDITVTPALWDSDQIDWKSFDALIIRSVWDYWTRYAAFQSWLGVIENLDVPIWNPLDVLRWNSEKLYMRDLAAQGVAMVPTVIVPQHTARSLEAVVRDHGWSKAIVKPTIAAGAYETWMTDPQLAREDQSAFDSLLKKSDVMVQPFIPEVTTKGEWSFLFFNKDYSHAVLKNPRPGDFRVQTQYGGTMQSQQPPAHLVEQAAGICRLVSSPLLYARVDGVEIDGKLVLMELELFEPSLFFATDPLSPSRFADALEAVLKKAE
jgi:glutathione synthase/RimK-type ligase-like ATP-grasp enzyme